MKVLGTILKELKETGPSIDKAECVYCGHFFDAARSMNYNMDEDVVDCPKCKKKMNIYTSFEFVCRELEE